MDQQFLTQLKREESELSRKLNAIREVISVYAPEHPTGFARIASTPASQVAAALVERAVTASRDTYALEIRTIAAEVISNSPTLPVPTKVIVDELVTRGIEIRGQSPLNAVSALLSRSNDFVSNGRSGWTLAETDKRYGLVPYSSEAPNGTAAGASQGGAGTPSDDLLDPFA